MKWWDMETEKEMSKDVFNSRYLRFSSILVSFTEVQLVSPSGRHSDEQDQLLWLWLVSTCILFIHHCGISAPLNQELYIISTYLMYRITPAQNFYSCILHPVCVCLCLLSLSSCLFMLVLYVCIVGLQLKNISIIMS